MPNGINSSELNDASAIFMGSYRNGIFGGEVGNPPIVEPPPMVVIKADGFGLSIVLGMPAVDNACAFLASVIVADNAWPPTVDVSIKFETVDSPVISSATADAATVDTMLARLAGKAASAPGPIGPGSAR